MKNYLQNLLWWRKWRKSQRKYKNNNYGKKRIKIREKILTQNQKEIIESEENIKEIEKNLLIKLKIEVKKKSF